MVFDPGHPDANSEGMVAYPNINIHEEMADLIVASRAYEANLAVVKNARSMALQTLAIGKREFMDAISALRLPAVPAGGLNFPQITAPKISTQELQNLGSVG